VADQQDKLILNREREHRRMPSTILDRSVKEVRAPKDVRSVSTWLGKQPR